MSRQPTGGALAGVPGVHDHGKLRPILARIRAEYAEMPGLCLTRAQAQRLWGLDGHTCDAVLAELVHAGYLKSTARGFLRA